MITHRSFGRCLTAGCIVFRAPAAAPPSQIRLPGEHDDPLPKGRIPACVDGVRRCPRGVGPNRAAAIAVGTFGTGTLPYLKEAKRRGVRIVCVVLAVVLYEISLLPALLDFAYL